MDSKVSSMDSKVSSLDSKVSSMDSKVISMGKSLADMQGRVKNIELTLENEIKPQNKMIIECYLSTYERYKESSEKFEKTFDDVANLKIVVAINSERLNKIEKIS